MKKYQVIVVGGGPAGLMAAGQASKLGATTLLLEKKHEPGRKLRITGKGRCNLTNTAPLEQFITHFGKNGKFLRQSFNRFFSGDLADFFNNLGIEIKKERGGRIFPVDDNAPAMTDALVKWVRQTGVTIKRKSAVTEIMSSNKSVTGVKVGTEIFYADTVIIATGGRSYPATGSTGDGYRLAASAGHTVIPARPALVPLETKGETAQNLQGLSLKNVNVKLIVDGKKQSEAFGEMIFTHFGLSGPIILSLSKNAVDALEQNKKVNLSIDLKPALDDGKLEDRLLRELRDNSNKQFDTFLKTLLPGKLVRVFAELVGIPGNKLCHQISSGERKKIRLKLKNMNFDISGHRSFDEAIVTAGGVDLREINPRTMESNLIKGLYIAGELLDVDGETGGFNLQAAFSTGWLAGNSAAEYLNENTFD